MNPKQRYLSAGQLKQALLAAIPCEEIDLNQVMSKRNYLPPGFRSGHLWHMLVGVSGYLFVIAVSVSIELEASAPAAMLFMHRLFCGIMFLAIIAFRFDYLGIQRFFPFMKQRSKSMLKGYIAGSLLIVLIVMSIQAALDLIIWPS